MAREMVAFGLIDDDNVDGLVEERFARQADLSKLSDLPSVIKAKDTR
jgi:hypothetical protein